MESLDQKLLKSSLGEHRLKPDEQRYFLGTYKERVVLTATLEEITQQAVADYIASELVPLSIKYPPLSLKLSPELDANLQMLYMKLAKDHHLAATIVDETNHQSPFALVLHTNHVVDIQDTAVPNFSKTQKPTEKSSKKRSLLKKFFGS